jgi:hypothetical protein
MYRASPETGTIPPRLRTLWGSAAFARAQKLFDASAVPATCLDGKRYEAGAHEVLASPARMRLPTTIPEAFVLRRAA